MLLYNSGLRNSILLITPHGTACAIKSCSGSKRITVGYWPIERERPSSVLVFPVSIRRRRRANGSAVRPIKGRSRKLNTQNYEKSRSHNKTIQTGGSEGRAR